MVLIPEAINLALAAYEQGDLSQAEGICHQILQQQSNCAEALHLLGAIAYQTDQPTAAIHYYQQAIAHHPTLAEAQLDLANLLLAQGQVESAIWHYRQAYSLIPDLAEIHYGLGLALSLQGNLAMAIAHYQQAIALEPDFLQAQLNLAVVLRRQGQDQAAIAHYQQALALNPDLPEVHSNLGVLLVEQGQLEAAIYHYQRAIALKPDAPEVYTNLGIALMEQRAFAAAIEHHQQAIALKPDYAKAHLNLGVALTEQGQFEQAVTHYQQALALRPDYAEAYTNLGVAQIQQGQVQQAIADYRQAIALKPDDPEAHYNLAGALLLSGEFLEGWLEYEWRWQRRTRVPPPLFLQPMWDGANLANQTILLHGEQGLGDEIQFIRYAPLVAAAAGRVVVECAPALRRLFKTVPGIDQLVIRGQALPMFDVHAPLLSLPRILATTLENLPNTIPYLSSPPTAFHLPSTPGPCKIGIVWASGYRPELELYRTYQAKSCPLSRLLPAVSDAAVSLYSLQVGEAVNQLAELDPAVRPIDLSQQLQDFADTAAAIAQLDLVISVDTAVAHLAGAMGKPTWVLLPFVPDWRWLLQREDSPWYPTMRLFRQNQLGDWQTVMQQVSVALTEYLAQKFA